ncbi:MAG: thrombospondin type 3 repeat-containing protein [Saprospiraceae bacterium]|nr:thrombospondin type 3 repeat-containing protein [Saprospiraceae bacterium]
MKMSSNPNSALLWRIVAYLMFWALISGANMNGQQVVNPSFQQAFESICDSDFNAAGINTNADSDSDGITDDLDNCPFLANPNQENNDGDGEGDLCDPDDDNDGIEDTNDDCPFVFNDQNNAVLSLDGIDDYVSNPPGVYFYGDFTIEAWVYPRTHGYYARILDFGNGASSANVWLGLEGTSGFVTLEVWNSFNSKITSGTVLPLNQWTHVSATLQGTAAKIYYNGSEVASGSVTPPINVLRSNNYLGKSNWASDAHLHAGMSDVRLWNHARTQAEIQTDMGHRLLGSEPGLVAYWRLNDTSGTTAFDASMQGYDGILLNGAFFDTLTLQLFSLLDSADTDGDGMGNLCDNDDDNDGTPDVQDCQPFNALVHPFASETCDNIDNNCNGQIDEGIGGSPNRALFFDGVNDFVRFNSPFIFNQQFGDGTLSFWLKRTGGTGDNALFWTREDDSDANRFNFLFYFSNNLSVDYRAPNSTVHGIGSAGAITLNEWTHVSIVRTGNQYDFYKNGVWVNSNTDNSPDLPNGNVWTISGRGCCRFEGLVDEIRFWNYPQNPAEIVAQMNQKLTGNEPGLIGYWDFEEQSGSILHDRSSQTNDGILGNGNADQMPQWVSSGFCLDYQPGLSNVHAFDDQATVQPGTPTTVFVLANDIQENELPLKVIGVSQPLYGTVQILAGQQALSYKSTGSFAGEDMFTYIAGDSLDSKDTGLVRIVVLPPKAELTVSQLLAPTLAYSGQLFEISWAVMNLGHVGTNIPEWTDRVWLSADTALQNGQDMLLGTFSNFSYLLPNESYVNSAQFDLPNGFEGDYFIIVETDAGNALSEYQENNNIRRTAFTINITPGADLRVEQVLGPDSAFSGTSTQITWSVKNYGEGATNVSEWFDHIYFNQDSILNFNFTTSPGIIRINDISLGSATHTGLLQPDSTYTITQTVVLPHYISGWYFLKVYTDIKPDGVGKSFEGGDVYEYDAEFNNSASIPVLIKLSPHADLEIESVQVPMQVSPGENCQISWTTGNNGFAATSAIGWSDGVFISVDSVFDTETANFLQDYNKGTFLAAGQNYQQTKTVKIPLNLAGRHYIHVAADRNNQVFEGSLEGNNIGRSEAVEILTLDLAPADLIVSTIAGSGMSAEVAYTVTNQGTGTIWTNWKDRIYLSKDSVFNAGTAILIGSFDRSGGFAPETPVTYVEAVEIPQGLEADYFVFLEADWENTVYETETLYNNLIRSTGTISLSLSPSADLQVQQPDIPNELTAGSQVLIAWEVKNTGSGATSTGHWKDEIWLSNNATLDANDQLMTSVFQTQSLPAGGIASRLAYLNFSASYAGSFYLIFRTDVNNTVYEHQDAENNNVLAVPVMIQTYPPVDLAVSNVTLPGVSQTGQSIHVTWLVTNTGSAQTLGNVWRDDLWFSVDSILDANDLLVGQNVHTGALGPSANYTGEYTINTPDDLIGEYFLLIKTNATNQLSESSFDNNVAFSSSKTSISLSPPSDLKIASFHAAGTVHAGQPILLQWTVLNAGVGTTNSAYWYDAVFLSDDPVWTSGDLLLGTKEWSGLLSGSGIYVLSLEVDIPSYVSGNRYLILRTDNTNLVYEHNAEGNNDHYVPIQVLIPPPCDLIVSDIELPDSVRVGDEITVQYSLTNAGVNPANGYITDAIYFSADSLADAGDALLGTLRHIVGLAPGETVQKILTAEVPGILPGQYLILGKTNIKNNVKESSLGNNITASADSIRIDIHTLYLDIPDSFALGNDQTRYFRLEVPDSLAGNTLKFMLNSDIVEGFNEIYVRYGEMPSLTTYDYRTEASYSADQSASVPSCRAGLYYILVRSGQTPAIEPNFTLLASIFEFELTEISPNRGGKDGRVTVKASGYSIRPFATAYLSGNGPDITSVHTYWVNEEEAYFTFDLEGAEVGTYNFFIQEAYQTIDFVADTTMPFVEGRDTLVSGLESAFEIVAPNNKQPAIDVIAPVAVRPNDNFTILIEVENTSNNDMLSPILLVYSNPSFKIGLVGKELLSYAQKLLAVAEEGPPGVIRPNGKARIVLYGRSPLVADTLRLGVELVSNSGLDFDPLTEANDIGLSPDSAIFQEELISFLSSGIAGWEQYQEVLADVTNSLYFDNRLGIKCGDVLLEFLTQNRQDNFFNNPGSFLDPGGDDQKQGENQSKNDCPTTCDEDLMGGQITIASLIGLGFFDKGTIGFAHWQHFFNGDGTSIVYGPGSDADQKMRRHADARKSFEAINLKVKKEVDLQLRCKYGNIPDFPVSVEVPDMNPPGGISIADLAFKYDYEFDMIIGFGSFQGATAVVKNIKTDKTEDCKKITYTYTAEIHYSFSDNYSFDNDCGRNAFFEIALNLENCGIGTPFSTKIQTVEFISGTCIFEKDNPCCAPPCPVCQQDCTHILVAAGYDPNDIIGPPSYSDRNWVARSATLPYTIRFENDSLIATAPAQNVSISQKLDSHIDARTFRLGSIGFGSFVFPAPDNQAFWTQRFDLRDSLGIFVDVLAGIDVQTNTVFWNFKSIDPATGQPPINPYLGFLAINDNAGNGQGFVNYTVRADEAAHTGDTILAKAKIVFDLNAPIETPQIFNTIDAGAPNSLINPIPAFTQQESFLLQWSGNDDLNGSGVGSYDIFASVDGNAFQIWADDTTVTSAVFYGESGRKYSFYSIAVDHVGNRELDKSAGDWVIEVGPEKTLTILSPDTSEVYCTTDSVVIKWTALHIAAFDLSIQTENGVLLYQVQNWPDTSLVWSIPEGVFGDIVLIVSDTAEGSITIQSLISITAQPTPTIVQQGDSLVSSAAQTYQWLLNGAPVIPGATGQVYYPSVSGNYSVVVTDSNGCKAVSGEVFVEILGATLPSNVQFFELAPNPTHHSIQLTLKLRLPGRANLILVDAQQRVINSTALDGPFISKSYDLQSVPVGVYYLKVLLEDGAWVEKVIKVE